MRVALMIPCYVDLFYRETGIAALELLEKLNVVDVVYPPDHTCCGLPMANSGCYEKAQATEELFIRNFSTFGPQWLPDLGAACCQPWSIWGTLRRESILTRRKIPQFASLPAVSPPIVIGTRRALL